MVKKKVAKTESKEEDVSTEVSKESKKVFKFVSKNYWMIATILLGILLVSILIYNSVTTISSGEASEITTSFLVSGYGLSESLINITSVVSNGDLYFVNFSVQGQDGSFVVSKDGSYFGSMIETKSFLDVAPTATGSGSTTTEIPKSDKPVVELYVWAYCPYGVLAQGPMAEVAALLGDDVEFTIVPFLAGHDTQTEKYESQQNKIQSCIQKLYPEKYWAYAGKFVSDVYTKCSSVRTEECDKTESVKAMKALGIDSAKVLSCVSTDGDKLYADASAQAQRNGVTGSPTITINGVQAKVDRTSESIKTAICGAFNSAPSACSNTLSSSSTAASGSC